MIRFEPRDGNASKNIKFHSKKPLWTCFCRSGDVRIGHNCLLTHIMQRDLLPHTDYVQEPNSWLFSWDNYNPECVDIPPQSRPNQPDHGYPGTGVDVWKVYSVNGWPCRAPCEENKVGGFWSCDLDGRERGAWDYCCSPDHQCGFSNGYSYSWYLLTIYSNNLFILSIYRCYVGVDKTQWRKCSDQYYPYLHNLLDSNDVRPKPHNYGIRPDRPDAPLRPPVMGPSLDEYEGQFDEQFLSPPKPGTTDKTSSQKVKFITLLFRWIWTTSSMASGVPTQRNATGKRQ